MQLQKCFTEISPPLNETFSFRKEPCHFEQVLVPEAPPALGAAPKLLQCPFRDYCLKENQQVVGYVLRECYSPNIKNLLSESSSSIVIRSEHQFHQREDLRFSLRKHFYEVLEWGPLNKESPAYQSPGADRTTCFTHLNEQYVLGQYLGFLDLRLHFHKSPIAMSLLAIPRRLQADPDAYCITGEYGMLFAGPIFPCSPFSMQDPKTGGAKCAQACMIMVSTILADRGAVIHGSYDLTYLAKGSQAPRVGNSDPTCLAGQECKPLRTFAPTGLNLEQMTEIFRKRCFVSPSLIKLPAGIPLAKYRRLKPWVAENIATRIIHAYLQARFPIILGVDAVTWAAGMVAPKPKLSSAARPSDLNHAVTIIGYRRSSKHRHRADCLIVHDPASYPYLDCTIEECYDAAWALGKADMRRQGLDATFGPDATFLAFLAVADERIRYHLWDCIQDFVQEKDGPINPVHSDGRPDGSNARMFEFFCGIRVPNPPWRELENRYHERDYRFVLMRLHGLHTLITDRPVFGRRKLIRKNLIKRLKEAGANFETRYWVYATYLNGQVNQLNLFDAENGRPGDSARMRIIVAYRSAQSGQQQVAANIWVKRQSGWEFVGDVSLDPLAAGTP